MDAMKLSWANRMTILRILLIVPFVICMLEINSPEFSRTMQNVIRYVAFSMFFVMAVSDALDGYFARIKKQITRLGAFLDPVADKLLITSACLLLSSQKAKVGDDFLLPSTVVVLIIGKDLLLVLGFIIVYFLTSQLLVAPILIGKIANALQLVMVGAILAAPEVSLVIPGGGRPPAPPFWPPLFTFATEVAILNNTSSAQQTGLVSRRHRRVAFHPLSLEKDQKGFASCGYGSAVQ